MFSSDLIDMELKGHIKKEKKILCMAANTTKAIWPNPLLIMTTQI